MGEEGELTLTGGVGVVVDCSTCKSGWRCGKRKVVSGGGSGTGKVGQVGGAKCGMGDGKEELTFSRLKAVDW